MSPVAAVVVRLVVEPLAAPPLPVVAPAPAEPVELAATLVLVPREVAELALLETGPSFPPLTGPGSPSPLGDSEPQAAKPSTEPAQSKAISLKFCMVADPRGGLGPLTQAQERCVRAIAHAEAIS